ncbi:MAG: SRPBCC family protein [Limisphaerales bacterium]
MNNTGLQTYKSHNRRNDMLTEGLGWFSVALGAAELLLPGGLARLVGVRGRKRRMLFRLLGIRELVSGVGILTRKKSTPWLWSRVAGDAMDLALLGTALKLPGTKQGRVAAAATAVAGVTVLDVMASRAHSRNGNGDGLEGAVERDLRVKKSVIIDKPAAELYSFWRKFENLPRVMYHLDSVTTSDGGKRSHWVAKAPGGTQVEWNAELVEDVPNERIAWRSLEGSDVDNRGVVRFERAPGGRGTMVTVEMEYNPPAGGVGAIVAKLFRKDPTQEIEDSMRYFKQLMETGMVVTTKGQSAGRKMSTSKKFDYKVPRVEDVEGAPKTEFAHS